MKMLYVLKHTLHLFLLEFLADILSCHMPERVIDVKSEITDRRFFPVSPKTQSGVSAAHPTAGNAGRWPTHHFPKRSLLAKN